MQTSIFQPTHTPATIVEQASGPMTGADIISSGQMQTQVVASLTPQPVASSAGFLNLDANTWLVLLVVLAAVIAMVLG